MKGQALTQSRNGFEFQLRDVDYSSKSVREEIRDIITKRKKNKKSAEVDMNKLKSVFFR